MATTHSPIEDDVGIAVWDSERGHPKGELDPERAGRDQRWSDAHAMHGTAATTPLRLNVA